MCLAEEQTAGVGRFGRAWHSPKNENLYYSLLYTFAHTHCEKQALALVVSLALVKLLKHFGINDVLVKWPNDILVNHQKIAGVLIESCKHNQVVIGIGLNVNMQQEQSVLPQATSMLLQSGNHYDCNEIVIHLTEYLFETLQHFEHHDFRAFMETWQAVDALQNTDIEVMNMEKKIRGKAAGIDLHGQLLLELRDGQIYAFSAGDTSLIKNSVG